MFSDMILCQTNDIWILDINVMASIPQTARVLFDLAAAMLHNYCGVTNSIAHVILIWSIVAIMPMHNQVR